MVTGYSAPMSVFFTYSSSFSSDLSCPLGPAEAVFPLPFVASAPQARFSSR